MADTGAELNTLNKKPNGGGNGPGIGELDLEKQAIGAGFADPDSSLCFNRKLNLYSLSWFRRHWSKGIRNDKEKKKLKSSITFPPFSLCIRKCGGGGFLIRRDKNGRTHICVKL